MNKYVVVETDLEYIRDYYGVPAELGGRVAFKGRQGQITGAQGPHILIRLDGEEISRPYHPTWELIYT